MKKFLTVVILSVLTFCSVAQNHWLSGESSEPFIPSSAWYWDPDKSGMGLNLTIQEAKHGQTGYFLFAAFYTYKPDGSQAWYTINSEYVPNPNVNAWREKKSIFGQSVLNTVTNPQVVEGANGNYWGEEDAWMGRVDSVLYETSGGMPLGGAYRVNDIVEYKDISLVWKNPVEIDIYIDGSETPDHTFVRNNLHGDLVLGDADYLTDGSYKLLGLRHGKSVSAATVDYIQSTMTFTKFDPSNYFDSNVNSDLFMNATEYSDSKTYYISDQKVGRVSFEYNSSSASNLFSSVEEKFRSLRYVVLVYDTSTLTISGFDMVTVDGNPKRGLFPSMGDYKFEGYLPPPDQGRISMYPSACSHCNGQSDVSFKPEFTRRSAWHLYKVPNSSGNLRKQLPDVWKVGENLRQ